MLAAKESPAIVSNAGNAPVAHIDRRKKTAAERDTPDLNSSARADDSRLISDNCKSNRRSRFTFSRELCRRCRARLCDPQGLTFSTHSVNDYRPNDKTKNTSLQEVLMQHADEWKRLNSGVHPRGNKIDADAVVLSTNGPMAITVPREAFVGKKDIRFFVEATLDVEHAPSGMVRFACPLGCEAGRTRAVLVDPRSPIAEQLKTSNAKFCRTFPNRFVYVDDTRGLSAGFHLIEGLFRDDRPLCKLVLNDEQNRD